MAQPVPVPAENPYPYETRGFYVWVAEWSLERCRARRSYANTNAVFAYGHEVTVGYSEGERDATRRNEDGTCVWCRRCEGEGEVGEGGALLSC